MRIDHDGASTRLAIGLWSQPPPCRSALILP
jgi:hypothetical protein